MSLSCQNLLLAVSLTIAGSAHGQSSLDELAGKFVKNIQADRKEKIILLTDKPFYAAGETIWLKAWCLDSLSNRFMFVSKNLYVDLVDDKDSVIGQLLFNIPSQKTSGKMLLPTSVGEGYYWLRAYTARMLKEDSSRIFVKPVYVVNPDKPNPRALGAYTSKSAVVKEDTSAPGVLFYPEGGAIISGTTATVAFRSQGTAGQPVDISGYITDPLRDTVARFSSTRGIGKFSFDAYNPRKYTAHILWRGREVLYPLPAINQFAYQLTVVSRDDQSLKMQVSLGDSLYKKHKQTRILGISRDSLCFASVGTDMYQVNVPLSNFPTGKATFFLFDDQDKMVSQRSVFVGSDSGRIAAATDRADYSPGDKVNLSIDVKAKANLPVRTTFLSVSVTDNRIIGDQGSPEASAEALPVKEDKYQGYSPAELDVCMLTEPLSYSDWGKAAAGNGSSVRNQYADSNLLYIRGKAVGKKDEPLQRHIVNLISGDNRFFMADTTDMDGRFLFPLSEYDDGMKFNMKITDIHGKGSEGKLVLDKMDYPRFRTPRELKRGYSKEELEMVRRFKSAEEAAVAARSALKDSATLKPVTVAGRQKLPPEDEARRASPFSDVIGPQEIHQGGVDAIYNAISSIPGFSSGMNRGVNSGTATQDPILILLDGVETNTGGDIKGFLESLDATNIEFIEILKGPLTAIYGMQGSGGVILITSVNKNQDIAQTNDKGTTTIYPKGYYSQSDVYAAGYDRKKGAAPGASAKNGGTLYWNSNIPTDDRGVAKVDFFTGQRQATYSAAIVGVTPGGDIVEKTIQIKSK